MTQITIKYYILLSLSFSFTFGANLLDNATASITYTSSQHGSYPSTRLIDGATDASYLSASGNFINDINFRFSDTYDIKNFDLFRLYNVGNSYSVRYFSLLSSLDETLESDRGKVGWSRAVSDASPSAGINMLSWIEGGVYQSSASQHNSYPTIRLNDGDNITYWLSASGQFRNDIEYRFDTDWDDSASELLSQCSSFNLFNVGNSYSIKEFGLEYQQNNDGNWHKIQASANVEKNILSSFDGGEYLNTASQHNSYPATRVNDTDKIKYWLSASGQFNNTFDFQFDQDLDGTYGDTITFKSFNLFNVGNSYSVQDFEIYYQQNSDGNWVLAGSYSAASATGKQVFNVGGPINNVTDVRVVTLTNHGNGSYIGAKEFEVITDGPSNIFTAASATGKQTFDVGGPINNVTQTRVVSYGNYGNGSYVGAKEFEVITDGPSSIFTAASATGKQTFDVGGPINNVTQTRVVSYGNYGNGSYVGAKEFEVITDGPSNMFTAASATGEQNFIFNTSFDDISDFKVVSLGNYGNGSYVGAKEFELVCDAVGGNHTFSASSATGWQDFSFPNLSGKIFRLHTTRNYANGSYIGANEIQLMSAVNATAIAEYRFDECAYDTTVGEVEDSIDGDNNGTLNGSIDISSNSKVCNSAEFSGGAIDIDNLDVDISAGAKTTVSFWMYWDGTNSVMPFGWDMYDLWFYDGSFGFNSAGGDIFGISSAGLTNAWHHVSAVFTNGDMVSNKLYIDGVDQNLTQRRNSPNNTRTVVQSSARIGGWLYNGGYHFSGNIDELNIHKGELDSAGVNQIMNATHSCKCPLAVGSWNLDECFWNGSNDEVEDSSSNGYHGTALLGATTQKNSDAGGGTCNVGLFSNNYVALSSFPHLIASRSITAWFQTTNRNESGQRIFVDDENNNNGSYALSLGDSGAGRVRFYIRGLNSVSLDSASVIQNNQWYFAAATFDASTMKKRLIIYDDSGNVLSDVQATVSGSIGTQTGTPSIGGETDSGETGNRFSGNIDEVKVYDTALNDSQIQSLMGMTHPCGCAEAIANYRFDECGWYGSVGEVGDKILGDNNGTRTDANVNTSDIEAKVCKSALFAGGAVDIHNLDVDISGGAKNSVAFWMYWDGTNNVMPFGWYSHDLWFRDGNFGFNSASGDIYGISSAGLANGWHHVAAIFTNRHLTSNELYIDGVKQVLTQRRNSPNNTRAVVQSSARIGGWLRDNGYRFRGYLDEFYIYKGSLKSPQIQLLMADTHPCGCIISVNNYRFDAWDTFRNINDRNISTKISAQDFNLVLASLTETNDDYQEFNGTLCTQIIDTKHANVSKTPWIKTLFSDSNTSVVAYRVYSALEEARVFMKWQKDSDVACNAMVEDNSTLSSDAFAVRPENFTCNIDTGVLVAELDYPFRVTATQFATTNATPDYNTSNVMITPNRYMNNSERNDSLVGNFSTTNIFPFKDGNSSSSGTLSFSDVAIIGIDINDSTWANIDSDDTLLSDRIIHSECNRTFGADHFDVVLAMPEMENNTTNFTYLSNDLNMSASVKNLNVHLSAKGKNGGILKNYKVPQSHFFAKNIDITPSLTLPDAPHGSAISIDNPPIESNTILNFDEGSVDINYTNVRFNYPRIYKEPQNPFLINGADANYSVNVVENANSDVNGSNSTLVNANATFYFGRLHPKDVKTSEDPAVTNIEIEVYDKNSGNFVNTFRRNSLHWYRNEDHNSNSEGNVSSISAMNTMTLSATSVFDIAQSDISSASNGLINVTIAKRTGRYFLHVKTQPWLWYAPDGFGNAYDDSVNSQCTDHPCFSYTAKDIVLNRDVSSGTFSGSDVVEKPRGDYIKKGIKVFR